MLLGNIDVLMLSQYSDAAVAAVGMANQFMTVGLMVLGIVSLGSSVQLTTTSELNETRVFKIGH